MNNSKATTMKKFEELTYADNFLFGEVMMDEETSKNVLEIILGIEIAKVVILEKEKQLDLMPDGRGIRMDIYVRDENQTVYNIEMQMENKYDTPKRSRYYQGLLESKNLPSGSRNYNQLADSYVIFICQFDPFGQGMCCYTFEERCLENPALPLGDGTKKIFLNTRGKNRSELSEDLRDFLDYVKAKDPAAVNIHSHKVKAIDHRVSQLKTDAEVRSKYMTLANWIDEKCEEARQAAIEEGRAEGLARGKAEGIELGRSEGLELGRSEGLELGRSEGHSSGLQEGKLTSRIELIHLKYQKGYSVEKTAEVLELDTDFITQIYELLQADPEASNEALTKRYQEQ